MEYEPLSDYGYPNLTVIHDSGDVPNVNDVRRIVHAAIEGIGPILVVVDRDKIYPRQGVAYLSRWTSAGWERFVTLDGHEIVTKVGYSYVGHDTGTVIERLITLALKLLEHEP